MFTKTVLASAALAAVVAAYDLPQCWSDCFSEYQVKSEGCLCSDSLGDVVSSCIVKGCTVDDSTAYAYWLAEYCDASAPSASNTWSSIPASTAPPAYSSFSAPPAYSSSEAAPISSYPVESSSWAAPSYPASSGSSAAPVYSSSGSVSYSTCTETLTWIYRSTTLYPTTVITHSPGYPSASASASGSYPAGGAGGYGGGAGGYPTGAPSYPAGGAGGYPTGAAASTGYIASSYVGPYATGAAAPMATAGAGMAMLIGGVAAAFI